MTFGPEENQIITLKPEGVNVKLTERSKGRLKFQIKLSKDEAEAFNNYSKVFKDPKMPMDEFVRVIFFTGMTSLNDQVVERVKQQMEEKKGELEEVGVDAHQEVVPTIKPLSENDSTEG